MVRGRGHPADVIASVRAVAREIDSAAVVSETTLMRDVVPARGRRGSDRGAEIRVAVTSYVGSGFSRIVVTWGLLTARAGHDHG
jgi:hypothetical protein